MCCNECGSTEGRIIKFKRMTPLCWSHYLQMRRHGRALKRTKYTPNTFIEHGDHAEVVLYTMQGDECGRALIDIKDLAEVRKHKWHLMRSNRRQYAQTIFPRAAGRRRTELHSFLLGVKAGMEIDHRNGNGLDCRRVNLRFLSHHANVLNVIPPRSGRIGVRWRERGDGRSCWVASIMIDGKRTHRHFKTFEEAVTARRRMELDHLGITAEQIIER